MKNPSPKLKAVLAEIGASYEIKELGGEHVIYRKLGRRFELEVSGLNNRRKEFKATIFVWDISSRKETDFKQVEKISAITSVEQLKHQLSEVANKYEFSPH